MEFYKKLNSLSSLIVSFLLNKMMLIGEKLKNQTISLLVSLKKEIAFWLNFEFTKANFKRHFEEKSARFFGVDAKGNSIPKERKRRKGYQQIKEVMQRNNRKFHKNTWSPS